MAKIVRIPRERITQEELEVLERFSSSAPRYLRRTREMEEEWLGKLREGAAIEPGPLSLEFMEERELVRRLKVVRHPKRRE